MSDLQRVGPVLGGTGTAPPFTSGISGAQRVSDAHGKYWDAVWGNRAYSLSVGAAGPTAYVGAAGGTPLLAVHNPANSGKMLSLLGVGIAGRAQASAAGSVAFNVWAGVSVTPTGTQTAPTNMLNRAQGGSAGIGFSNTALTGSTALALAFPLLTYYWATAASATFAPGVFDIGGAVVAVPGNQIAIGASAALTSATYDIMMFWEELPYLL